MASTDTAQQLTNTINEAITRLATATDATYQDATFRAWLKTIAAFHKYSWGNQLLIWSQCPTATRVAGFNTWKQLGRNVRKGEKAIHILAPMVRKPKPEDGQTEPNRPRIFGFRAACVFDYAQTEGQDLAPTPTFQDSTGGDHLLPLLQHAAAALGVTVELTTLDAPGLHGYSKGGTVVINDRFSLTEQAATLAHELAHEMLHQGENKAAALDKGKKQRELEAEATAYVFMAHFGIEQDSRFYLASYSITADMLTDSMATISATAQKLIGLTTAEVSSAVQTPTQDTTEECAALV